MLLREGRQGAPAIRDSICFGSKGLLGPWIIVNLIVRVSAEKGGILNLFGLFLDSLSVAFRPMGPSPPQFFARDRSDLYSTR